MFHFNTIDKKDKTKSIESKIMKTRSIKSPYTSCYKKKTKSPLTREWLSPRVWQWVRTGTHRGPRKALSGHFKWPLRGVPVHQSPTARGESIHSCLCVIYRLALSPRIPCLRNCFVTRRANWKVRAGDPPFSCVKCVPRTEDGRHVVFPAPMTQWVSFSKVWCYPWTRVRVRTSLQRHELGNGTMAELLSLFLIQLKAWAPSNQNILLELLTV